MIAKWGTPLLLLVLGSCQFFKGGEASERPLARVGDRYLYAGDLMEVIPPGTTSADSIEIARNFIDNWIRETVVLQQAEDNLTTEQQDVDLQVERYRNSLLIHNYERNLIDQKLDTVVGEEEMKSFYEKNQSNFRLLEHRLRCMFIKADRGKFNFSEVQRLMRSERPDDLEQLKNLCTTGAIDYSFDESSWLSASDLVVRVPVPIGRRSEVFQRGKLSLIQEDSIEYYLYVADAFGPGELPPLELVKDDIQQRVVSRRRVELIDKMRTDLLNDALNNKNAETFSE
ncbi:MAG TPA: peptidylprolyl isomerase [Luteibaculaceae bacterium]|nr:peptidylprolyl isomerase [Luteibaculaceae bacterium]